MLHRSYTPAPPLGDFVQDFWLYENYVQPHVRERILPCGTIELVVNLRDDELRIYDVDHPELCRRYSGALVSGAYSRSFIIDTDEETALIGAHFKPGGAFPFLGLPAGELSDVHVDLETLWGRSAADLRARLCEAVTPGQRFRILEEELTAHLFRPLEHHRAVPGALEAFGRMDGGLTIREITRRVGLSQRQFIQVFTAEVGMTPKIFSRVQRFQRALASVRQCMTPDWASLALECGYFDQSHLIRDFVTFSGFTPSSYLQQQRYLREQQVHIKRNHLPLPK